MYIWLKRGVEEEVEKLKREGKIGDLRIETDSASGRKHVTVYHDVTVPTADVSRELLALAEKLTFEETIYEGFCAEGVYRRGCARLTIKTDRSFHGGFSSDTVVEEINQRIFVSAPSLMSLRTIYSLVRQRKLEPKEKWAEAPGEFTAPSADTEGPTEA